MNEYRENQFAKEVEEKAEQFIKRNYEDISKVTIREESLFFYPADLSGVSIGGYVNDDEKLFFSIDFYSETNVLEKVSSITIPDNFPPEKEECKKKSCQD